MSEDIRVYDLGEVRFDTPKTPARPRTQPAGEPVPLRVPKPQRSTIAAGTRLAGPGLVGSLSLFLPGAGQVLAGEPVTGLFFVSGIAFALVALHALLSVLDRVIPTLQILELPRAAAAGALALLVLSAATLHVTAMLHAHALRLDRRQTAPHPVLAGLASALVPGWGQLLVGHRVRAAIVLGGVWTIALAWLCVTPRGFAILQAVGIAIPPALRDGAGPIALVTGPVVLWTLAVYDASMGAFSGRR